MIARAHKRGYPIPNAFMSSKPDAGINHKVYGVTSEGVAVFADVALHAAGFTPREPNSPFTVKITGGPDGDVAGNIINILNREYGENVVIVAIADGTGCAEDPAGLPMAELLRLATSLSLAYLLSRASYLVPPASYLVPRASYLVPRTLSLIHI